MNWVSFHGSPVYLQRSMYMLRRILVTSCAALCNQQNEFSD